MLDSAADVLRWLIIASGAVLFCQCVWRVFWPGAAYAVKMRVTALGILAACAVLTAFSHIGDGWAWALPLALLGMRAVFAQAPWLYLGFKIAGGAYLLYLAFRMWMGAKQPFGLVAKKSADGATRRNFHSRA